MASFNPRVWCRHTNARENRKLRRRIHVSLWYSIGSMVCPNRNWRLQAFETCNKSQFASKIVVSLRNRTWILERMCLHSLLYTPAHAIVVHKYCKQWNVFLSGTYSRELVPFSPKFSVAHLVAQTEDVSLWATFWTKHPTPVLFMIPFTHSPLM